MENLKKKCSLTKHSEIDAIKYCHECKIYLCNKCQNLHSELFENHNPFSLEKDLNYIYSDICKQEKHNDKLEFFCRDHNLLCCPACICKIKNEGYGQHTDCNVCPIKDIKNEKKNKLKENIKSLEQLFNKLEQSVGELKILFEKFNQSKETLKLKIQKIFTKIRNSLNEREDEILLEVDKQYNNAYFNEVLIKEGEKLPNKIKNSLERGKIIDKEWDDNKIIPMINDCINIENNIKNINKINENIEKFHTNEKLEIKFNPEEKEINRFLDKIKTFGKIICFNNNNNNNNFKYKFKKCPNNIKENKKYIVTGENENIITKIGYDEWVGILCESNFEKTKEYKWKIKILKSIYKNIMFGVAPIDLDINTSSYDQCGWYLFCFYKYLNPELYSGPPHNNNGKKTNLNKVNEEIIIIMNMNKKSLKFIINNEDNGDSYTNIPIDKPITPAIFLYNKNDSVQIIEC